jgi:predicted RNase H-like HicB family nuclease
MKFLIAIEPGTATTAHGVVVPDLPGCFSAGDTLEEAFDNAREAIELHCQTLAEDGGERNRRPADRGRGVGPCWSRP